MSSDLQAGDETLYHSMYQDGDDVNSLSLSLDEDAVERDASSNDISFESYWTGVSDEQEERHHGQGKHLDFKADGLPLLGEDIPSFFGLPGSQLSVSTTLIFEIHHIEDDDSFSSCNPYSNNEDDDNDLAHPGCENPQRYQDSSFTLGHYSIVDEHQFAAHVDASVAQTVPNEEIVDIHSQLAIVNTKLDELLAAAATAPLLATTASANERVQTLESQLASTQKLLTSEKLWNSKLELELGDALREVSERDAKIAMMEAAVQTDGDGKGDGQEEQRVLALEAELRDLITEKHRLEAAFEVRDAEATRLVEIVHALRAGRKAQNSVLQRISQRAKDVDGLTEKNLSLEKQCRNLEVALEDGNRVSSEMEKLKADVERTEKEISVLKAQSRRDVEAERTKMNTLSFQKTGKITQLQIEVDSLKEKKTSLEREVDTSEKTREEGLARCRELEAELLEARQAKEEMVTEAEKKDQEITTLKRRDAASRSDVQKMKKTIEGLYRHKQLREMVHESLRTDMQQRDLQLAEAKRNVGILRGQLEEAKKGCSLQAQKKASTLEAKQDTANAIIAQLTRKLDSENIRNRAIPDSEKLARRDMKAQKQANQKAEEDLTALRESYEI
ncbi:hypothetical protein V5O48_016608 [Marasmius crinis-equi]|uniref:Uncharacterized protein n=1 Tax=Marasmius crinis-equi TaxID=585013 RepID=A0ABR3ERA8_9AGAR